MISRILSLFLFVSLCSCSSAPKKDEARQILAHLIDTDGRPIAGAPEPEVVQLEDAQTLDGSLRVTVGNIAGDYVLVCDPRVDNVEAESCSMPRPNSNYLLFRRDTEWLINGAQHPMDLKFMVDWAGGYNDKENIGILPAKKSDEQFRVFWLSSWRAKGVGR